MMYCTVLFSLESIASFRGLFVVVYFGVGKSIGAGSGSWLQDVFGERGSFRVLSWVAFASAFLYAVAFYGHKRWRMWRGEAEKTSDAVVPDGKVSTISRSDRQEIKNGIDNPSLVSDE
ncbi:hypothetical protein E2C01_033740 [Portunus trituberculatus]|uniref:Major facilitator superfamily associated domain-containing protein n=1 Tax=Portunus trituberculatus TaxID=210409 RepID=A0A5B7F6H0_PORTR|nr:hypothetical protein [Portunus trituberculatus]